MHSALETAKNRALEFRPLHRSLSSERRVRVASAPCTCVGRTVHCRSYGRLAVTRAASSSLMSGSRLRPSDAGSFCALGSAARQSLSKAALCAGAGSVSGSG